MLLATNTWRMFTAISYWLLGSSPAVRAELTRLVFKALSNAAHTFDLASDTCWSLNVDAAGATALVSGIGRSQAATAAPTATSVIANMTTTGQRAGPREGTGGQGICGTGPGGNPGGGGVFDMRRMLSPITNGGIQLSDANENDGEQTR
jgi:microcystin degradation protein MlrC